MGQWGPGREHRSKEVSPSRLRPRAAGTVWKLGVEGRELGCQLPRDPDRPAASQLPPRGAPVGRPWAVSLPALCHPPRLQVTASRSVLALEAGSATWTRRKASCRSSSSRALPSSRAPSRRSCCCRSGRLSMPRSTPSDGRSHTNTGVRSRTTRVRDSDAGHRPHSFSQSETRVSSAGVVDFFRAYEVSPAFEPLMDLPSTFPVLAAALRAGRGGPAGEPRLRTPVTQLLPGHTRSTNTWHRDGGHIRLTYILDDMPHDGGGTAMVAGTHLDRVNSLQERLPLPSWFRSNPLGAPSDAPPEWRVVTPLAGMPAGSCLINWTDIVHRRTDNQSAAARRTFWQVFNREANDLGDRLW